MCGIIGIAGSSAAQRKDWLLAGRDVMSHRGPDDAGVWWSDDGRVGLGHRRLSIVDLSPLGHQPMLDANGRLAITFNGEIYNFIDLQRELAAHGHQFRSRSDTEVVLAAYRQWGIDCLSRLNGMFALAIYDADTRKMLVARDRAGEKPLFYSIAEGSLRFASELKGLLADTSFPRRIDPAACDLFLAIGYVPGERCLVQGIAKLPPAHALIFDLASGAAQVSRYWQLPAPPGETPFDKVADSELLNEFEVLLDDAVRRQMHADVPIGVLLSGGVDSSLITAMAARHSRQVKTFTVGFPGFGKYDETPHARLVADHFGTEHIELEAGNITPQLMPILARQYDEPMIDSSMLPTYLVSQLVRRHCTVALGGDGADELFGGYHHYSRLLWTQAKFAKLPMSARRLIALCAQSLLPTGFKARNWLQSLRYDLGRELPRIAAFFDADERRRLLDTAVHGGWSSIAEGVWNSRIPRVDDLLQRATRMEFENYMPEDILVKVDRASMLNSLEVRAPMLDYRIVEFAFGRVPTRLKANTHGRKILPKQLAAKLLPPQFDQQRKQGFSVPLAEWLLGGSWRDLFYGVLTDKACMFDAAAIRMLLDGQDKGRQNQERLFGLVLFELWRREYRMSI